MLACSAVLAQAYRWVDEDGVVHFSDRPHPGAEQIVLPTHRPSSSAAASSNPRFVSRDQVPRDETEDDKPFSYSNLAISSPGDEQTLWNIEGVLNVNLMVEPELQPGHRIRVYINGASKMVQGTSFQLQEIWRGTHTIQAEILDANGKTMIRSTSNRFYVQQNSIAP